MLGKSIKERVVPWATHSLINFDCNDSSVAARNAKLGTIFRSYRMLRWIIKGAIGF